VVKKRKRKTQTQTQNQTQNAKPNEDTKENTKLEDNQPNLSLSMPYIMATLIRSKSTEPKETKAPPALRGSSQPTTQDEILDLQYICFNK